MYFYYTCEYLCCSNCSPGDVRHTEWPNTATTAPTSPHLTYHSPGSKNAGTHTHTLARGDCARCSAHLVQHTFDMTQILRRAWHSPLAARSLRSALNAYIFPIHGTRAHVRALPCLCVCVGSCVTSSSSEDRGHRPSGRRPPDALKYTYTSIIERIGSV